MSLPETRPELETYVNILIHECPDTLSVLKALVDLALEKNATKGNDNTYVELVYHCVHVGALYARIIGLGFRNYRFKLRYDPEVGFEIPESADVDRDIFYLTYYGVIEKVKFVSVPYIVVNCKRLNYVSLAKSGEEICKKASQLKLSLETFGLDPRSLESIREFLAKVKAKLGELLPS